MAVSIDKRCCLPTCGNTRKNHVILHRFPNPNNNRERFEEWRSIIGGDLPKLDSDIVFKYRRICHNHFETKYHTASGRLSSNAVPTLRLSGAPEAEGNQQLLVDITNRTVPDTAASEGMGDLVNNSTTAIHTPSPTPLTSKGMMEEYLDDFLEDNEQYSPTILCNCCLSSDRDLYCIKNIVDLYEVYRWIVDDFPRINYVIDGCNDLFVCWECQALLKKFVKFKQQVNIAQEYIQSVIYGNTHNNQDHTYTTKCLSSLDTESKSTFDNVFVNTSDIKHEHDLLIGTQNQEPEDYLRPILVPKTTQLTALNDSTAAVNKITEVNSQHQYIRSKDNSSLHIIKLEPINVGISSHYVVERMTEQQMSEFRESSKQKPEYAEAEYKCMLCILGFNTKDQLEEHFTFAHSAKPGQVPCSVCQMWMDDTKLSRHVETHYYRYMCRHCAKVETDLRNMRKHVRTHVPRRTYSRKTENKSKDDDSDCSDLSVGFPYPGSKKTTGGPRCENCNITFETSNLRRIHMYREHSSRVICDYCKKQFVNKSTLTKHIRRSCHFLEPGQATQEKCPICLKMIRVMYLKGHIRRHQSTEKYECKKCNKTFSHSYTYKGHFKYSRAHITDFEHRCPTCKKGYLTKNAMQDHFNYHHLGTTMHKCTMCHKALATRRSVAQHMRQVHMKDDGKPNICEYCGRGFRTKRRMREHERTHTNEKPLMCDICHTRFRQASCLFTHKRRVHNVYPLQNTYLHVNTYDN